MIAFVQVSAYGIFYDNLYWSKQRAAAEMERTCRVAELEGSERQRVGPWESVEGGWRAVAARGHLMAVLNHPLSWSPPEQCTWQQEVLLVSHTCWQTQLLPSWRSREKDQNSSWEHASDAERSVGACSCEDAMVLFRSDSLSGFSCCCFFLVWWLVKWLKHFID